MTDPLSTLICQSCWKTKETTFQNVRVMGFCPSRPWTKCDHCGKKKPILATIIKK